MPRRHSRKLRFDGSPVAPVTIDLPGEGTDTSGANSYYLDSMSPASRFPLLATGKVATAHPSNAPWEE